MGSCRQDEHSWHPWQRGWREGWGGGPHSPPSLSSHQVRASRRVPVTRTARARPRGSSSMVTGPLSGTRSMVAGRCHCHTRSQSFPKHSPIYWPAIYWPAIYWPCTPSLPSKQNPFSCSIPQTQQYLMYLTLLETLSSTSEDRIGTWLQIGCKLDAHTPLPHCSGHQRHR
jgi:hypothetical protein